jgi:hypothetical protein
MTIPKPFRPEYSTTIPSSGKKIKFQPFTVREEKVLVLASETQDLDEITNAVSNVIQNCVTSPDDFKVEDLALFDIEYLFLKARTKSAGETVTVKITDPSDPTFTVEHEINIDKIKIEKNPNHTDVIDIAEDTKVKMKYPDISFFNEGINVESVSTSTKLIARCVSQIVVGEEVYSHSDLSESELVEWVESLTTEQFTKILEFFRTMPKLSHTIRIKNTNTNSFFTIKLEGLADFF